MTDLAIVVDQMLAAGMPPPPSQLSLAGKVKRYGPKKRAWYVLREIRSNSGQFVIVGAFGEWGRIETTKVEVDWRGMAEEERENIRARLADADRAEAERRARRAALAALRAAELWRVAAVDGSSPYLVRKRVHAESVRFLEDGSVVVPMIRYDLPREMALVGAQMILSDGSKRFTPGTAKAGSACRFGLVEIGAPVLLCEGVATGLSIRSAIDRRMAVFAAFDAGNLMPVALVLRALYPASPILVCADDDWRTEGNPGIAKASLITKRVPYAHLIYPVFGPDRGEKDTDFNDLHILSGHEVVARQFHAPLQYLSRLNVRVDEDGLDAA